MSKDNTELFGVHVANVHCYQYPSQGQPGLQKVTHFYETHIIAGYEVQASLGFVRNWIPACAGMTTLEA
jgi:hypothetical protein